MAPKDEKKPGDKKDDKKDKSKPAAKGAAPAAAPEPVIDEAAVAAEKKRKEEEARKLEEQKKAAAEEKRIAAAKKAEEDAKKAKEDEERRKKEKAEREAKQAAESEAESEAEIAELESVRLRPNEVTSTYTLFPSDDVYVAYARLQAFARDLNCQVTLPEIVLVGKRGCGKSSIIEALLGHVMLPIGEPTRRPLFLQLVNNIECATPKITVKRDSSLKEFDHDHEVSLADLAKEIERRSQGDTTEGIYVSYEYKAVHNMILIDTPGLGDDKDANDAILRLAMPAHRSILAVEQSGAWDKMEMVELIKACDPELSRTSFVYSNFHTHLQRFTSTRHLNRYLGGTVPDVRSFFTTTLPQRVRAKFSDEPKLREKVAQLFRRDLSKLEGLQYDKRFESSIGINQLRRFLMMATWKQYQDVIPDILKRLRARKAETSARLQKLQDQLASLDSSKLRSIASQYVVEFLQSVDRLLAGTSEGNPAVHGQTLNEEKAAHGEGDWIDAQNRVIKFDPEEWNISYHNAKLYGGQQFERLLVEFKAVAEHSDISEMTIDDVATAAGINRLSNLPNYSWAAAELATTKARETFQPLIEQTISRAVFICKRLSDLAERMMENRHHKNNVDTTTDVDNVDSYPYYVYHVRDLYNRFVDRTAQICSEKALDEFMSTRTVYWDITELSDRSLPTDRVDPEATYEAVTSLATELFNELRARIVKNILLKMYNFFLVPLQTTLWSNVQSRITSLSDSALEQIFEISATKARMRSDEAALQGIAKLCGEQEVVLLAAATQFAHPQMQ